ncbi:MAG: S-adenosylmethionine:tRNA ribosyltransferase-isomerase, partial [Candidatus Eremiobacteraeota bacterium]|nr:S-adenosylmethionine:tRNA ribosyltransferase-isomerase [Candidatus Eremiobacteraeota bacterium]
MIARAPAEPADASRLLVSPADGSLEHKRFTDLPTLLQPDYVLVVNETHVIRD